MGEMADYYLEQGGYADEYWGDGLEHMHRPSEYMLLSDDMLRKLSAGARSEKLKGIRAWPKPLSFKQRYCLAAWIANHENQQQA